MTYDQVKKELKEAPANKWRFCLDSQDGRAYFLMAEDDTLCGYVATDRPELWQAVGERFDRVMPGDELTYREVDGGIGFAIRDVMREAGATRVGDVGVGGEE